VWRGLWRRRGVRGPLLRGQRARLLHPGDHLQICGVWRGFRSGASPEGFYLHHHVLLPSQSSVAHSPVALVALHDVHDLVAVQLRRRFCELAESVVLRAAAVLLSDDRQRLHDSAYNSLPGDASAHIATDALHHSGASHPATSTGDSPTTTSQTVGTSGPPQLRSWRDPNLVTGQEDVVLQRPSCRLCDRCADCGASASDAGCACDANCPSSTC